MPFPTRTVPNRSDIPDVIQRDAANILQKANVSNLIGLLNQLNDVSLHASEIFSDILSTTEKTGSRIQGVSGRIRAMASTVESTEKLFLNNAPSYFYDHPYTDKEWQRRDPLRGLLFRRDRAGNEVNRRREVGMPLPDLSAMDVISASGPCIKKFSDSNFFMNEWLEAEKKKMAEEKAKRKERKKKRRRKKREVKDKIKGIERWVYDPVTGKKVKKQAEEIKVETFTLSDANTAANFDFKSSDQAVTDRTSQLSPNNIAASSRPKSPPQQSVPRAVGPPPVPIQQAHSGPSSQPPPNPMIGGGGGGGGPPPVPSQVHSQSAASGPVGGPPPVPGVGGPPAVPQQAQRPTAAEIAARSRASAEQSGALQPTGQPAAAQSAAVQPARSGRANLLAGITGGAKLKKAVVVKREPQKLVGRNAMLEALKNKGKSGLRKVVKEEVNVKKEEKVENSIFAILNRRQYIADSDDETGSDSDWDSES